MSSTSLLNIGSSGLQAFQRSLNTIGHNIANVNTNGYSKQSVSLVANTPSANGYGFAGSGVSTSSITRSYDAFIESSLRSNISTATEFQTFYALASQLDDVLANPDTGISSSMQQFFNSLQDVADNPSGTTAREVLFKDAQYLAEQFNELSSWLENVRGQVNNDIRSSVSEINRLSSSIADLNGYITVQEAKSGGQPANDLLDQRDSLIQQLSELVSVTTVQQDDGSLNVMTSSGQNLVVGSNATTLDVFIQASDPGLVGVAIRGTGGVLVPVTEQMTGGKLGGTLSFRDRMLDPAVNSLGLSAIGLSTFINEQQVNGMDLDGQLGVDMFNVAQPEVLTIAGSPGIVSVSFDNVSQLTNKDYTLGFNSGSWQLTQNDTKQTVSMTGSGTAADPFIADGLSFEITAAPVNGDTYLIRPTRNGAQDIEMALSSGRQIAAAAPVSSSASLNNTGSGAISAGVVTDINSAAFQTTAGALQPPLLIRFTSATTYDIYNNTNPAAPALMEAGINYAPSTGGDVFPTPAGIDPGYQMRLTGAPGIGDEFSTKYNTGGIGDNRNALLLAAVATNKTMANGTASINDSYNSLVADVGTGTKQAELNSLAQQSSLEYAESRRASISSVNLDEEAANLLRFQQAYQAAAQVITVANTLFDTLLNSVRR